MPHDHDRRSRTDNDNGQLIDNQMWTEIGENALPTRRIFELVIVTGILMRPAFGQLHLWANKALNEQPEGTFLHGAAKVIAVVI